MKTATQAATASTATDATTRELVDDVRTAFDQWLAALEAYMAERDRREG